MESNLDTLLKIGLAHIPENSRMAQDIRYVMESCKQGVSWQDTRNGIIERNRDLGWFQAPMNVAFTVIGLLYGEGDFGKTLCTAVNCGDDTDCTGATAGALLGIIGGRSSLPGRWCDPIGDSIVNVAINPLTASPVPKTLQELTDRVITCKRKYERLYDGTPLLTDGPEDLSGAESLLTASDNAKRLLERSSLELLKSYDFGEVSLKYDRIPELAPGESLPLRFTCHTRFEFNAVLKLRWHLPEGWRMDPLPERFLHLYKGCTASAQMTITAGEFHKPVEKILLEMSVGDREQSVYLSVPFLCSGANL